VLLAIDSLIGENRRASSWRVPAIGTAPPVAIVLPL
jgi:hypothetical protein